jgi:hypothetical protein
MSVVKMKPIKFSCKCGHKLEAQGKMGIHIVALNHIRVDHPEAAELLDTFSEAKSSMENGFIKFFINLHGIK